MANSVSLSQLIIPPNIPQWEEIIARYPTRSHLNSAKVVRIAPSPTGSPHFGIVYVATLNQQVAQLSQGTFVVRIEDTDEKREVENGIQQLLDTLNDFQIEYDEGPISESQSKGKYGPYIQSQRQEIYLSAIRYLLDHNLAYPCFCTESELEEMRQQQQTAKVERPGYYGQWAKCRHLTIDQIQDHLQADHSFTIRFRTPDQPETVTISDLVKGEITFPGNDLDYVILKSHLGLPVYHLAAMVDDHLQGINLVLRGDEWLSSLPFHLQLISAFGWHPPQFGHFATIMKQEGTGKRKLSKRKDPEAAASYYISEGFPALAVKAYVFRLANSNFEEWRNSHPTSPLSDYPFAIEHMTEAGGSLFDLVKLTDISKNEISHMSALDIYQLASKWAQKFNPKYYDIFTSQPQYTQSILNIERQGDKVRKDLYKWSQLPEMTGYFFDELFSPPSLPPTSEHVQNPQETSRILSTYLQGYSASADKEAWLTHLRSVCTQLGYAENLKTYKTQPGQFQGHIGDITMILRQALTGHSQTPDLFEIMQVMGQDRVRTRLSAFT